MGQDGDGRGKEVIHLPDEPKAHSKNSVSPFFYAVLVFLAVQSTAVSMWSHSDGSEEGTQSWGGAPGIPWRPWRPLREAPQLDPAAPF